jgi:hypothetical protein
VFDKRYASEFLSAAELVDTAAARALNHEKLILVFP